MTALRFRSSICIRFDVLVYTMDTEYRQFHEKLANRQLAATVGAAVVNSAFQAAQLKQAEVQHQERLLQDKIAHIEQMAAFEERNREVDYLNTLSLEGKKVYAQLKELGWSRQEIAYVFTLSPEDQGAYYTLRESGWQHEEIAFHLTLSPEGKQAHLELKDAGWGIKEIKHFLYLSPVERMTYLDEKEAASQRAAAEAARTAEWKETAKRSVRCLRCSTSWASSLPSPWAP